MFQFEGQAKTKKSSQVSTISHLLVILFLLPHLEAIYLLPHLYASIVQSMTQMFPIWFTLGYDYLARSINIARVQMIQLWLQFEHTSIKQTMHDNYITFNQSDRRQNVHSTPSGRHCESPSSSFILPKYFSSLSAHSYSSASDSL